MGNLHRPGIEAMLMAPKMSRVVTPVSGAEDENVRLPRGRPAGSKNKPKPPIIVTRHSANALRVHAMELSSDCDVNESLTNFARRKQRGICILGGSGCVTNVTLCQSVSSGAIVTLHGRYEILYLLESILPPPAPHGRDHRANHLPSWGSGPGSGWSSWCTHCSRSCSDHLLLDDSLSLNDCYNVSDANSAVRRK